MTQFTFDSHNHSQQFIRITAEFETNVALTKIQLPSWRPGRYELANFAKYIRNFNIVDEKGNALSWTKITKDSWEVNTSDCIGIKVEYQFYSNILNAGSTFLDENQLYVNPVNCCVYTEETYHQKVLIRLLINEDWQVASSLTKEEIGYSVANIDELMDTPFIASSQLQQNSYESNGTTFYVWFNGEVKPDWERLIKDFKAFTDLQINKFTEFPVNEYHFLNQILPYRTYHGVEHQKSTVISLGPSYEIFSGMYDDLLGVSSHELYHTWNVKAIRPIEMFPYDFSKENYSKLGYLYEGVTTYQGDMFLFKSGVFSEEQYFKELSEQLQKHFDNHGRFNYSVAESSFDTWLDGYVPGAPARKVSIYTEGCLLAFVTDVRIRIATDNKYGIDEVMKRLYFNYALENKGVSEGDYQNMIEAVSGISFQTFFDNFVYGNHAFESIISEALEEMGLELIHDPSENYSEGRLGMKITKKGNNFIISNLYPGGPAENGKLSIGDEIIAVNGFSCQGDLNKWLNYFDDDQKEVTVIRNGRMLNFIFPEVNRNFYMRYSIAKMKDITGDQKRLFDNWKK